MRTTKPSRIPAGSRAWCMLIALALASCGGGGSGSGSAPPAKYCSTGTELVLFYPVPGTKVPAATKSIYVASNYAIISQRRLAARPSDFKGGPLYSYPLTGPVAEPTPTPTPTPIPTPPSATPTPSAKPSSSPTPFPTPPFSGAVYYVAQGFHLKPQRKYTVEVASQNGTCIDSPIQGAMFSTFRF
jgi:hypothetical protein